MSKHQTAQEQSGMLCDAEENSKEEKKLEKKKKKKKKKKKGHATHVIENTGELSGARALWCVLAAQRCTRPAVSPT